MNIGIKHCFFYALTFARSRGRCWKLRTKAEVFNTSRGTWQTLMYWKTMFDRCYCIISTKCSVTLAKNVALYFVNVWQSTPDWSFLLISVCLAREHQSIHDGRHRPIRPWSSRKGSFFETRWSPTSALVQMISKFINKKEIDLPLYAIIFMHITPTTFLCHPAVLDCRNLFLS